VKDPVHVLLVMSLFVKDTVLCHHQKNVRKISLIEHGG